MNVCHFEFCAIMAHSEANGSPLALSSPSWNWLTFSQKTDASCNGNSKTLTSVSPCNAKSKPLLLHPPRTSTQLETKRKPMSTATDRAKPVTYDNKEIEEFSQVRITDRTMSMEALRHEMKGRKFIKLQQMDRVPNDTFINRDVSCNPTSCRYCTEPLETLISVCSWWCCWID